MKQRFRFFTKHLTSQAHNDRIGGISNELYDNVSIDDVLTISGSAGYDGVYNC